MKFHLYGTSVSGLAVDEFAVTNSKGVATFKDVLIGSGYTLEEVDTAIRYVVPASQSAAVEWNSVTNKSFSNILKKFNVTVTKSDKEAGTAQGDASLAGATYGIYKGDQLVDTYVTDKNGQFTTSYYVCGDDWSIKEIEPSEGYLLDTASYHVGAEAKLYTVERNSAPAIDVTEQVQKGNIAIIKHTDDGETKIETPEEGAVFAIYLKSSGSFDAAKETERDYLTCDENGFAQSKDMPYGVYTVHQVSGWEGRELMPDFDVFIAKDGETYRYLINNANFESFIKVIKVDAESGKTIPYAGAGFQIYRPDGAKVEMTFTYPEVTTIDTFYTNDAGMLITPEKLEFGKGYSLVEVSAPYGYVLSSDPVKFDVTEDNSSEDSGVKVVEVKLGNYAQKGIIKISKSGEVFATVTEADGMYQPVYEVQGLEGATYEIKAAEDVYTLDGTLRYSAGEVVDTVTTVEDGVAESKPLYLGKYEIYETEAPFGMVINTEVHSAELVYAGQEIEITETAASFCNDRQKVQISLTKVMEQNKQFGIGMNDEMSAVTFGLYAGEELTAKDSKVIPADGLVEIISVAVVVVVVICLVALIVSSCFGIFFSSEDKNDGSQTMREVVVEINQDYQNQLDTIKANNPYDDLEMSGSRAVWPEVLSVYAVKTTTDPDNPQEVASLTDEKKQLLTDIFWEMNDISYRTETDTETEIIESDDGNGNILEETVEVTKTTLYITVSHKTADEMSDQYRFNEEQNSQLEELLNVDNSMWLAVLYGIYGSDDMIVQVALSQVGNVGGEPYWSWYGFGSRVEWCACFVSWCADQCGYIETGVCPKYAGCVNGVAWFKEHNQWVDGSETPSPGMIIFYDWDSPNGESGPQDGLSDHTGIVERVENGIVYTVEGNSGDSCRQCHRAVGNYEILGYGVLIP